MHDLCFILRLNTGKYAYRGKTLGVVGYGDIGQSAARIARAFKMNIIALRRRTELSEQEKAESLKVALSC